MRYSSEFHGGEDALAAFFGQVFGESEGDDEGQAIAALVRDLLRTPAEDLRVVMAEDDDRLAGAILFTRLSYDQDARRVFLMAPVAVRSDRQGLGIGQALIRHGLDTIRDLGADIAVTYGDPAYYGKTGFIPITEQFAAAPYTLSMPQGWQAQSLTGQPLSPVQGAARAVPGWAVPALW